MVNQFSSSTEKISLFQSLFRGRMDVYPRRFRNKKTLKLGYAPACKPEFDENLSHSRAGGNLFIILALCQLNE